MIRQIRCLADAAAHFSKPKRQVLKLTPAAVQRIRELADNKVLRVSVKTRGCSGLTYSLDYVNEASKFDEVVEQDGVKVLIDSKALMSLVGTEMDFVRETLREQFVFHNPNVKEMCGCGESFST